LHNATFRHLFWHTHHDFTQDMWAISASASELGLGRVPFDVHHVRLNDLNISLVDAMQYVIKNLNGAQERCDLNHSCTSLPKIRCSINKDRWDMLPDSEMQERYHAPHCNTPWSFKRGDVFTLVSFHKAQWRIPSARLVWMHTVFYGLFTASEATLAVPQASMAFASGFNEDEVVKYMYRYMYY